MRRGGQDAARACRTHRRRGSQPAESLAPCPPTRRHGHSTGRGLPPCPGCTGHWGRQAQPLLPHPSHCAAPPSPSAGCPGPGRWASTSGQTCPGRPAGPSRLQRGGGGGGGRGLKGMEGEVGWGCALASIQLTQPAALAASPCLPCGRGPLAVPNLTKQNSRLRRLRLLFPSPTMPFSASDPTTSPPPPSP